MALDFDQPMTLRSDDLPDPQALLIDLGALLRDIQDDAEDVRGIATREVAHRRLTGRAVDLFEGSGRARELHERLTRALRAAGRL